MLGVVALFMWAQICDLQPCLSGLAFPVGHGLGSVIGGVFYFEC